MPAIDLRDGRVVRLVQGDFERQTAYSDDPPAVARSFADAGAAWLHVVDLDGARTGEPAHGAVIRGIGPTSAAFALAAGVAFVGQDALVDHLTQGRSIERSVKLARAAASTLIGLGGGVLLAIVFS